MAEFQGQKESSGVASSPDRRRLVPWFAGLLAVILGIVALVAGWDELSVWYWMRQYRESPHIDHELLGEPEDSVRYRALLRFVKTPTGKERLLRTLVPVLNENVPTLEDKLRELGPTGRSIFILTWVDDQAHLRNFSPIGAPVGNSIDRGYRGISVRVPGSDARVSLALKLEELSLHAGFHRFPVPEGVVGVSGVRFSVVSLGEPDPRCKRDLGSVPQGRLGNARHACLFEKEGWSFLETSIR